MNRKSIFLAAQEFVEEGSLDAACRALDDLISLDKIHCRRHPLGFLHYSIMSSSERALRVHVWPVGQDSLQSRELEIHNHVFRVDSRLIVGELENTIWEVEKTSCSDSQIFDVSYDDDNSVMHPSGNYCNLRHSESQIFHQGDRYKVEKGIFHQTNVVKNALCATFFFAVQEPGEPTSPQVVGPASIDQSIEYQREWCSDSFGRKMLGQVLESLKTHE